MIADVGQGKVEEIDFQKADDAGGRNYGWNIVEGDSCYNPATGCNKTGITMPIYEYFHNGGGGAIIGGYVYRSAQSKLLWGQYIFTDEILKFVDGFYLQNGIVSGNINHFITSAQAIGNPVSFGRDKYGDQYIIFFGNGTVYKLQDTSYIRRPKAYFTPVSLGNNSFLLEGLQGKSLTYQWLKDSVVIPGAISPDYTTSDIGSYTLEVTNSLGFKDTSDAFLLGSSLNLKLFTAQKISGGLIALNWQTASELNISGYTIQRRKNNETDFSNIGFVASKSIDGFSNTTIDYTFIDSSASNYTRIFYRLQIVHADGSFTYSNIIFVTSDETKNGFIIFPNPAKGQVQIYLNEFTQPVELILYDNAGKKIKQQTINQPNVIIDLPASRGLYIAQVSNINGDNKVRKKIVVL